MFVVHRKFLHANNKNCKYSFVTSKSFNTRELVKNACAKT